MKLSDFLGRVQAGQIAYSRVRALIAETHAPEFNSLHVIDPNEIRLSRIIGWMLNPSATHGQGSKFLKAFVQRLDIPWDEDTCSQARIELEVLTTQINAARRIDILVRSADRAFAIENKPWAADQEEQVSEYLEHLDASFGSQHCLVYLSGSGSGPSSGSISEADLAIRKAARQLLVVHYRELIPWLSECQSVCRAKSVWSFLDEFTRYIQQRFAKETDMTNEEHTATEITTSPAKVEMVDAAFRVITAERQIKASLLRQLESELGHAVSSYGWTLTSMILKSEWPRFEIRYAAGDAHAFTVEFRNRDYSDLCYGIRGVRPTDSSFGSIRTKLVRAFGQDGREEHVKRTDAVWPYHRRADDKRDPVFPVHSDWSASGHPWVEIASGEMAKKIVTAALSYQKALATSSPNGTQDSTNGSQS